MESSHLGSNANVCELETENIDQPFTRILLISEKEVSLETMLPEALYYTRLKDVASRGLR